MVESVNGQSRGSSRLLVKESLGDNKKRDASLSLSGRRKYQYSIVNGWMMIWPKFTTLRLVDFSVIMKWFDMEFVTNRFNLQVGGRKKLINNLIVYIWLDRLVLIGVRISVCFDLKEEKVLVEMNDGNGITENKRSLMATSEWIKRKRWRS